MALIRLEDLSDRVISPCCHVAFLPAEYSKCPSCEMTFPAIQGIPILVDFGSSILKEDVVARTEAASTIRRRHRGRFASHFQLHNPVAQKNIELLLSDLPSNPLILIVGGGSIGQGMSRLYEGQTSRVVAFDIYATTNVQLVADGHSIPFERDTFDAVVIQAVLEHVLNPSEIVAEIWRVLKPAGLVYAETPFLQAVHEGPYDFQRFTESGHRWLFRHFELIRSGVVGGPMMQLLWSINYAVRSLFRSRRAGIAVRTLLLPLLFLDRYIPAAYASDAADCTFFLGRKSPTAMQSSDIVDFYRGAY
jgi:SAM-dependent methyltransferase